MVSPEVAVSQVKAAANGLGLINVTPVVLSDACNLILHLAPYPVVARMAKPIPGDDPACLRAVLARELDIARHLLARGVPVVPCAAGIDPGPHPVCGTWMTLWAYVQPVALPAPGEVIVISMIQQLAQALADYAGPLPVLGAWENLSENAGKLRPWSGRDARVAEALVAFDRIDGLIRNLPDLVPAHGDAHPRNLVPGASGWLWNDFEDVSLMPEFWDLASFIGNTALFHGMEHRLVRYVLNRAIGNRDQKRFLMVLKARALFGTISNLAMAYHGYGDLEFAESQLERIGGFLKTVDAMITRA